MTFEELGMIPKQINREIFACPCGGCVCNHCVNNVDCMDTQVGEAKFGCFNCDECLNYNGNYGTDNWRSECMQYRVTDAQARRIRRKFKIVTG